MGLLLWLPLNGNPRNQGLSIANASTTNVTYTGGKTGSAATFSDSRIELNNVLKGTLSEFSICFWYKTTSIDANDCLYNGRESVGGPVGLFRTGSVFRFDDTAQTTFNSYTIPINTWIHCCFVRTREKKALYINGEFIEWKNTMVPTFTCNASKATIGTSSNIQSGGTLGLGGNKLNGQLNDYRIYSHALSQKEIKEIYKGLFLHYKLDGASQGGNPNLFSGNFNCRSTKDSYASSGSFISKITADEILARKGDTLCLSFDCNSMGASTSSVTTYQKDRFGLHGSIKYTLSGGTSTQAYPLTLFDLGKNGRVYTTWQIPTNLVSIETNLTIVLQTNPASGFAKPDSGNNETWYIKDIKLEWGTKPTPWCPHSDDPRYEFYQCNSVKNLLPEMGKISNWIEDGCTISVGNGYTLTPSGTGNNRVYCAWTPTVGEPYKITIIAKAETNGTTLRPTRSVTDYGKTFSLTTAWHRYETIITPTGTGTISLQPSDIIYISYIKISKPGDMEEDVSGFGYNGVKTGTISIDSDSPRYEVSTKWEADDALVTIPAAFSNNQFLDELTISIWGKTNTLNGGKPNLISLGTNYFCRFRIQSATSIWYYININGTMIAVTLNVPSSITTSLLDNKWHMYTLTFKNGISAFYIDGVLLGETDHTETGNVLKCSSTLWYLGGYTDVKEKFNGSLSDFRAYATALSENDILELYEVGASIDNAGNFYSYSFKEE